MGTIKNRTTLNGQVLSLVANPAVGALKSKNNSFDNKYTEERSR